MAQVLLIKHKKTRRFWGIRVKKSNMQWNSFPLSVLCKTQTLQMDKQ